jgi:archaellum component FlaC
MLASRSSTGATENAPAHSPTRLPGGWVCKHGDNATGRRHIMQDQIDKVNLRLDVLSDRIDQMCEAIDRIAEKIGDVRSELWNDIEKVRRDLDYEIDRVRSDVSSLERGSRY